ncbi:MAG: bifunctional metallophosphatase/5'-nucleotidase [Sphingomonadales bacterium]|nr:bifunctional metallophosphatase/5'-nucleotidase [Sphingomonadales bacterium]MBD3775061.1 bifunctional metallophosphatase/5'-nucleotidase [Paracoccaceae bacterium]
MLRKTFAFLALPLALAGCATLPAATAPETVRVRIIGINDFHGNLQPLGRKLTITDADGTREEVRVAGAAALASAIESHRAQDKYSLVISAGDLISASPLISSLFLDEPTITAMNRIGLDFNAVGNHEFDRGWKELRRMQDGGCDKNTLRTPCAIEPFAGAKFSFLAANVAFKDSGQTLFPASAMRSFGKGRGEVKIGIIGLTLKDTPMLVTPSGVAGLDFSDEANAINGQVARLEGDGADAIVVAIHQGLFSDQPYDRPSCDGINGELLDILKRLDPRVDLVISGHTHQFYICDYSTIDPSRHFLVTSAGYGGSFLTDIALTIDPKAGDVVAREAHNVLVRADGPSDPDIATYVGKYAAAASAEANRVVGRVSGAADKAGSMDETALGNLVADAQLAATREAGAQIAFMNNSGLRAALEPGADGQVTFANIYAVQPFANTLITRSYTGRQLLALLEQEFDDEGIHQTFSASEGFALSYDMSRPIGSRVVGATLNGRAIDPDATYRITMNSFLAAGGDGFTVFKDGTDTVTGPLDLDAMEAYFATAPLIQLPATGRITDLTAK